MSFPRRSIATAILTVCLLPVSRDAAAQFESNPILYYEPIDITLAYEADSTATASISVFGRTYDARLSPNRALIRNLPAETRASIADVDIWEGELDGRPGSWIRLVQHGRFTSGMLSDGITTWRVEPFDYVKDHLVAPNTEDAGKIIVYQQPGNAAPFGDVLVAAEPAASSKLIYSEMSSSSLELKPALTDGVEVEIAVAGDVEFATRYSPDAESQAIAAVNDADGLFVQQVGIHLAISELDIFDAEPDPFDASDPEALLSEFQDFAGSTPGFDNADLAHLLTNRSLGQSGQTITVGLANLGGICQPGQGAAISASTAGNVVAHEIAHNFGVPHDGEAGYACANEAPGYLMDPLIADSANLNTFSDCSINVLKDVVASAPCLSPIPPSDLVLSIGNAPTDVFGTKTFLVDFDVESVGTYDSLAIELSVDSPSASIEHINEPIGPVRTDCDHDAVSAFCTFQKVPANGSIPFEIFFNATHAGDIAINFDAWSLNDGDPANNHASIAISVAPAVSLTVRNISVSPERATPNELVTVDMDLFNEGIADATDVQGEATALWNYFEFVSADLPSGSDCTFQANGLFLICPIGDIPMGQSRHLQLVMRALNPDVTGGIEYGESFNLNFSAAEANTGDDFALAELRLGAASVDLSLAMTGPNSTIRSREASFSLTLENLGPDTADGVEVSFVNPGLEITFAGLSGCTVSDDTTEAQCPVPALDAGETIQITFSGPANVLGSYSAEASVTASGSELNEGNNSATFNWDVTNAASAPPPSTTSSGGGGGGGGGGGAMNPVWILLLGLAGLIRTARGRCSILRPRIFGHPNGCVKARPRGYTLGIVADRQGNQ